MDNNSIYKIKLSNKKEFKKQFDLFYPALFLFAIAIIHDDFLAEDIVQEVFIILWEKSDDFNNANALKSFLYTSVKNKCLNHIEHEKVKQKYQEFIKDKLIDETSINNKIIEEETHRLIYNAINELPPGSKNVLLLSINGLKNNEIAEELNISVNSVKTQKKIAYKQLKIKLKDIYSVVGFLFVNML